MTGGPDAAEHWEMPESGPTGKQYAQCPGPATMPNADTGISGPFSPLSTGKHIESHQHL